MLEVEEGKSEVEARVPLDLQLPLPSVPFLVASTDDSEQEAVEVWQEGDEGRCVASIVVSISRCSAPHAFSPACGCGEVREESRVWVQRLDMGWGRWYEGRGLSSQVGRRRVRREGEGRAERGEGGGGGGKVKVKVTWEGCRSRDTSTGRERMWSRSEAANRQVMRRVEREAKRERGESQGERSGMGCRRRARGRAERQGQKRRPRRGEGRG